MNRKVSIIGLPLAAIFGLTAIGLPGTSTSPLGIGKAFAQEDEGQKRKSRKVDSLRANVYEKIAKAQEKLEKGEKAEAIKDLNDILDDDINDYETAIIYQILATAVYIEDGKYKQAIAEYEKILGLERIPESLEIASLNALAQLYLIDEQYANSIEFMNRWLATQTNPGPSPYYFLAQAYYGLENYEKIIENITKVIDLSAARGEEPKENWYLLLRLAYFELGNYEKVREALEFLTVNWEKPEYWQQLAAVYSELGLEKEQLSTMEVAYRQGYLDKESHLKNMAQLYLYHGIPIKAAWVLEKGMKDGLIEKSGDNLELLGQSYLNAQEMRKAEDPLRRAAEANNDGEIWMRLGQVYVEQERWDEALAPLQKAASSADLDKPGYAHFLIGMTHFNRNNFDAAKKAFREARKFDETEKTAQQWLAHTDKEVERREQLSEYYKNSGGQ